MGASRDDGFVSSSAADDLSRALRHYAVRLGAGLDPLAPVRGGRAPSAPASALLLAATFSTYGRWLEHLTEMARHGTASPVPARHRPLPGRLGTRVQSAAARTGQTGARDKMDR
ncbi:MAG: hypothetical protein M0Z82_03630 [Actinomycetota bacterium]|nr:hypothetical protein [Actinomycetota bacterium]